MKGRILLPLVLSVISAGTFLYGETVKGNEKPFQVADLFSLDIPVQKGEADKKWFINLAGSFVEKSGNTDSMNTTYGGFVKFDDDITEFKIGYSGSYGKLKGAVNDSKGTGTINFDRYLFWRFEFFSYSMSDYNRITRLEYRNGSGAGGKFIFIKNRYLRADISGAPIFQYEDYKEQPSDRDWRWSVRGRVQAFAFGDKLSVKYYMFYIPEMKDSNNYRTIQEIAAEVKISTNLMMKTGYYREYNTYDKEAFQKNPLLKKKDSTVYAQAGVNL